MTYLGANSATLATVAGTTSSVTLFPAASEANGRVVYNDSSAVLYLAYGGSASTLTCTTAVAGAATYAFPIPVYAGQVTGAWASTAGTARTTAW